MSQAITHHRLVAIATAAATLVLVACNTDGDTGSPHGDAEMAAATVPGQPPTLEELKSATFDGILGEAVQLVDGRWEGAPFVEGGASRPAVGLVDDFLLTGDVDGDGNEDSVVLLWTSSGGSGTFDYVAVAGRRGDDVVDLGTAELGDRVKVRAGHIAGGRITLEVVQAGPEDALCCPTQLATRVWAMDSAGLIEVSSEVTGTMSLAALRGTEWALTHFSLDEPAPPEPEVTLSFEEDRITGKAGCNSYFSAVEENGPESGNISIGPVGATRRMCPEEVMAVEDRFLMQLDGVRQYTFLAGKLALAWQREEASGLMLFAPHEVP